MHPHLPATTPTPAPAHRTDPRGPASSPVDLTAALAAIASEAGHHIDADELSVTTGLRWDLVLTWVLVHRYLRSLLDEPIEVMRTATGRDGVSLHSVELAELLAFAAHLDAKLPVVTDAYRTTCGHIAHTGLGMAWPITPAPATA